MFGLAFACGARADQALGARLYGGDANTVHAAVEAVLYVLEQRKAKP